MDTSELKWGPIGLHGPVEFVPVSIEFVGTAVTESELLTHLGRCAGVAYRGKAAMLDEESATKRALDCIRMGHHSVLEHMHMSTLSIVDRGTSHALVRHRHTAFTQSSTIYQKYDKLVTCVARPNIDPVTEKEVPQLDDEDIDTIKIAAFEYIDGVSAGHAPSIERDLLPTMLATSMIITTHIGQYVYMAKRRQGAGDAVRTHVWAKMLEEKLRYHFPKTMKAFDCYYERRPL